MKKRTQHTKYFIIALVCIGTASAVFAQVTIPTTFTNAIQYIKETIRTSDGTNLGTVNVRINTGSVYVRTGFLQNGSGRNNKALGLDSGGNIVYVDGTSVSAIFTLSPNVIPKLNASGTTLEASMISQISSMIGINTLNPGKTLDILGNFRVLTPGGNQTITYTKLALSNTGQSSGNPFSFPLPTGTFDCNCDSSATGNNCGASFTTGNLEGPGTSNFDYCFDYTQVTSTPSLYNYDIYVLTMITGGITVMTTSGTNVGIGTDNPLALLHVSSGAVLFDGTGGSTPTSGSGTRFMWIPTKAAIRAGMVGGTEWNDGQVGRRSVAFGQNNRASDLRSTIVGGYENTASAMKSFIGGGYHNTGAGENSTIGGGQYNEARGINSTIGGGDSNRVLGTGNSIVGGISNTTSGSYAFIGGGGSNTASGNYSSIGGGLGNFSSNYSFIGGGSGNRALGSYPTIGGGQNNTGNGDWSLIGGGRANNTIGSISTIGGGELNTAASNYSTIGGGHANRSAGDYSTIGGGDINTATGNRSTIGGGYENRSSGDYSTIPGGYNNIAGGVSSFAAGQNAQTVYNNSFIRNSSGGVITGTAIGQFIIYATGGVNINTNSNTGYALKVGNPGDGTTAVANAWNTFSDARFKKDFTVIPDALAKIQQINGYYYYWKDGSDTSKQVGFVAQELEKVLPEVVNNDSQGYKSVDYGKISALLLQGIKEQQAKITELESRIYNLEHPQ